ncbi:hypothetical protein [Massilia consociata]|uniref:Uncharacterized protein n=1 Tax=Massilia consociata TaxID=760117 RepID=A0ABV6F9U6_9BURK
MVHLLSSLLRGLGRNLLLFAAILLVLASGHWLRGEWANVQRIVGELPSLQRAQADLERRQAAMAATLARELEQLSGAGMQRIDARIRSVDDEMARLRQEDERERMQLLSAALAGGNALPEQLARSATRKVELELRGQEKAHLLGLRARAEVLVNRQAALDRLDLLRREHAAAYAALQDQLKRRAQAEAAAGPWAKLFFTPSYRQLQVLDAQARALRARNDRAHKAFLAQQALLRQLPSAPALGAFQVDQARLAAAAAPLRERLHLVEELAARNQAWRAWQVLRPLLPVALALLLAWWLVPALMRALFYFVLAPLAARRPPIVIDPGRTGFAAPPVPGNRDGARISSVSQQVALAPGDELRIRPDYCQSQPAGARIATRLLFDWRRPLTSLAARLWMLKRLRATEALDVVVSSTGDALDEVALLELAAGQAFVLQPRALVGVVVKAGQRPLIRSHWRLGTLHAWLTLQLRYLAFEGPATLVVKGCRGVRFELAGSGAGRTVSQEASLGFSVDTRYATVRAEPFIPYLLGRQPLLHDRFAGEQACFLYEEVPRNARPGRRRNNPLDVLLDAGLKAFGI